jgi:Polyketide cyclase / dehydrase and lipid transport.
MLIIKILALLAVIILVFLVIVATRPADFRVVRSTTILAAPIAVSEVNDLKNWDAWSPWMKLDPNAKSTFEGPPAGAGAAMAWAGNRNVGEGRMTITESRPPEFIRFQLDFYKPMAGTSTAEFTFKSEGEQTVVTWAMFGKNHFMAKAFGLFVNCDNMIGSQFEKGLASMKSVVEGVVKK